MTTLVIDAGQSIVGIYEVERGEYVPYRGHDMAVAIGRIQTADEVVTYNGELYDFEQLGRLAGMEGDLPIRGKHIDMQRMCWAPIFGSSLSRTYLRHFAECPAFPFGQIESRSDDYEDSNQRDVYMTWKLWELWREGKLNLVGDNYLYH